MSAINLLGINVNEHTEKKNGLTYLSWAWAWAEVLKIDPAANYKVETFEGLPYMHLGESAMVWVSVTIFGKTITCQLPIIDYRNKCIPKPNAFDVNTSIMRCLTKGIAMHGLGLYIYAGEDLPMDVVAEVPAEAPAENKQETADLELFADAMIEYSNIVTDVKGLNSYWKSNQHQLDLLKVKNPSRYEKVLNRFIELKKQLTEKAND